MVGGLDAMASAAVMADCGPFPVSEETGELLRRAKQGDIAAFERIVIRHERQVLMTAFRLLGSIPDAQDVAQEVFLRLHRHLSRLAEDRALAAWLYRVTVNACHDARRAKQPTIPLEDIYAAPREDADAGVATEECRLLVRQALTELPERERAALVLRDLEGLSTAEVARILGSAESTVRVQISSARGRLRKILDRLQKRTS